MKKLLLTLALILAPSLAWGQCNGVFAAGTVCGSAVSGPPSQTAFSAFPATGIFITAPPYNAKCDGVTDDTTAIQAAINALPASGGNVIFPASLTACKVTSTLNIGNGTSSIASTTYGVHLRGQGSPAFPFSAGYPTASASKILWAGGASPVIKINGPLQGWGLHNLYIDGASTASICINVISAQFGDNENLVLDNCLQGITSTTVALFGALTNTDSLHNHWRDTNIRIPAVVNSFGIILSGTATTNTDYNTFINTFITLPSSVAVFGIYLQASDSNMFLDIHLSGGNAGSAGITFDYTTASSWPANNGFYGIDPKITGTLYTNTGSPGGSASPNWIYGLAKTNGATNPNLANLVFLAPDAFSLCGSTGNTGCINFNTQTSFTGYNFNWPTTAGVAGAGLTSGGGNSAAITWQVPALMRYCLTGVNFNSANTDNPISISPLPVTRYSINGVRIYNASASISTATIGVFTSTGGGGQTIAANQAITVTSATPDINNNTQTLTITNGTTEAYTDATLQIRIGTAQGSAATADVCVVIVPGT